MFSQTHSSTHQQVEKATSELLLTPDWSINIAICDALVTDPSLTKDVLKATKKRLSNKNPKIQLLTLTLVETMMKNCGDVLHSHVAEIILPDLVKFVKKKHDAQVKNRILELIATWQHVFGGANGRHRQYYYAYDELRRLGIQFPPIVVEDQATMFTSPQQAMYTPPAQIHAPNYNPNYNYNDRVPHYDSPAYGVPEWVPAEANQGNEIVSSLMTLSEISNAKNSADVLSEMLSALNPNDSKALKEELILELVDQCKLNNSRVMELVNSSTDEELLRQGLSLNDDLQRVLSKYEALLQGEVEGSAVNTNGASQTPIQSQTPTVPPVVPRFDFENDKEDEDNFSRLSYRSSQMRQQNSNQGAASQPIPPVSSSSGSQTGTFGKGSIPPPEGDTRKPSAPYAPQESSYAQSSVDSLSQQLQGLPISDSKPTNPIGQSSDPFGDDPFKASAPSQFGVQFPPTLEIRNTNERELSSATPSLFTPPKRLPPLNNPFSPEAPNPRQQYNPFQDDDPFRASYNSVSQPSPPLYAQVPPPYTSATTQNIQGGHNAFGAPYGNQFSGQPAFQSQPNVPGQQGFSGQQSYANPPSQLNPNPSYSPNQGYIAPWANPHSMTAQQRAFIYGPSAAQVEQSLPEKNRPENPGNEQGSPNPRQRFSPNQQAMLYGSSNPPVLALPPPEPSAVPIKPNSTSAAPPSPQMPSTQTPSYSLTARQLARNENPVDNLFGDLVDFKSTTSLKPANNATLK